MKNKLRIGYCITCARDTIPYRLSHVCEEWGECIDCAFSAYLQSKDVTGGLDKFQTRIEEWICE